MVWHGFHWNTTYGHMKQTFILKFTPRSWNHIFSTTKVKKWQIFHHKKINATQFLPQDHLHVMMQLSTNILFIYQTEKWLQSFGWPQWHPPLPDPFNSQMKHRPCRIAPKKSNLTDLRCISQVKPHAFGWDSLICEILSLNSFSVAILSLSWWRK